MTATNTRADVWRRIDRRGPEECWPFIGSPNTHGYGQMRIAGRIELVHRVAYEEATGSTIGDLLACHRCDNRLCCNPAHIFLGTNADNLADASRKQRFPRGEDSPRAKLTASDVLSIRSLRKAGASLRSIAERYAITKRTASMICNRETWRHV